MLNILIPMAGESKFFSDTMFPKPLFEIKTHPMVRYPIHFFSQLKGQKKFFVYRESARLRQIPFR
jgi:NDP-sugar pyrophosphorylase family protein